jgi:hypothetical protein
VYYNDNYCAIEKKWLFFGQFLGICPVALLGLLEFLQLSYYCPGFVLR